MDPSSHKNATSTKKPTSQILLKPKYLVPPDFWYSSAPLPLQQPCCLVRDSNWSGFHAFLTNSQLAIEYLHVIL